MAFRLRSVGQKSLGDEVFKPKLSFSSGILPTGKEVIEVLLYHLTPVKGRASISKEEAISLVAGGLVEHWVFQNIYTNQKVAVRNKIRGLHEEFTKLSHRSQEKRTDKWKETTLTPFLARIRCCLDISCKDQTALKRLENQHGVKMSAIEKEFLQDQLGERKMFCTSEVDRDFSAALDKLA